MKKNKNLFLTFKINKSILTVVLVAIVVAASFSVFGTKAAFTEAKTYSIVIDAGHGGIDGGSVGTSTKNKESDLNLE
ncbi:MAG: cell wall hydrolase, partial [Clostridia bacterium]